VTTASWFLGVSTLVLSLAACARPPSRAAGDFTLPVGKRVEVVRVVLPRDPGKAKACLETCEELWRVPSSHQGCLSRCPGATLHVGATCEGVTDGTCFDRVVAVPASSPTLADEAAEDAAVVVLALLLQLGIQVALGTSCDVDAYVPRCADEP
jgi:hypothetical protein